MRFNFYLVLTFCFTLSLGNLYMGYRIYEIYPEDEHQVEQLLSFSHENPEFDFLSQSGIPNVTARVIVSPENILRFEKYLKEKNFSYNITCYDLLSIIREQEIVEPKGKFSTFSSNEISFKKYNSYKTIDAYLNKLGKKYSTRVKVEEIGRSYEDRKIKAIIITNGDFNENKNVIFIEAGIHAREWIAPATALYIIKGLVELSQYNEDLLDEYTWIIIPLVNPDGYEYSQKKDRLWRKTRKPNKNVSCPGTDGNRNFDINWNLDNNSISECSNTYRGPKAFSEPETRAVRDLMSRYKNIKMFLSLHSFGRYILLPWSWDLNAPNGYKLMNEIATAGSKAISDIRKQKYMIGRPPYVLKRITGNSLDYAHGVMKIPVTMAIELAPGGSGFDPANNEIKGLVKEGWIGIEAMAMQLKKSLL